MITVGDMLDVCEQLEYMAGCGRRMLAKAGPVHPESMVLIDCNDPNERSMEYLAQFLLSCRLRGP